MLKKFVIFLTLLLWPLNLYLANTPQNFLTYAIPGLLVLISYFLYNKYPKYYFIPIIFIGVFEKKLVFLPIIFCLLELAFGYTRQVLVFLAISVVIFLFSFKSFSGQTIFHKDYEAEQLLIRNIHLYPTVFLARMFQNKPKIILDKFYFNLFALTDLNNYFFAFHPQPITINNQNLHKYPFLTIIFALYGIFYLENAVNKKFIIISILSLILSLSILTNFDRNDFILWIPVSLIVVHGINQFLQMHNKAFKYLALVFIFFAVPEIIRAFIK